MSIIIEELQKLLDTVAKAPWRVKSEETIAILDVNYDKLATANWLHLRGRREAVEAEANARLIALAPTLAARVIEQQRIIDALAQDASRAADLEKAAGEMAEALINAIAGGLERQIYRAANAALATYRETQK